MTSPQTAYTNLPYNPDDRNAFTYEGFRSFVALLLNQGYDFLSFADGKAAYKKNAQSSIALMRHDIDFDLAAAARMAKIEHEMGIKATYFLMLRSPHYNLMTKENQDAVGDIISYGHYIGLHFDNMAYQSLNDIETLRNLCHNEIKILSQIVGYDVQTVSFHRPDDLILPDGDPQLTAPYLNSYDPLFFKDFKYCADSKGLWRYGTPFETEAFKNKHPLHILIHPIWWTEKPTKAIDVLHDWAAQKDHNLRINMAENCMIYPYNGLNE